MNTFAVYQVKLDRFIKDGNFISEDKAKQHFDISRGRVTNNDIVRHYQPVCTIEANDLNEVFHIGNVGPEDRIRRYNDTRMHSISVGDVIINEFTSKRYVVKPFGFEEL
jgi:hypothetical protein